MLSSCFKQIKTSIEKLNLYLKLHPRPSATLGPLPTPPTPKPNPSYNQSKFNIGEAVRREKPEG